MDTPNGLGSYLDLGLVTLRTTRELVPGCHCSVYSQDIGLAIELSQFTDALFG